MVNVTKPVAKTNAQTQSTTKQRRPRNTELNSSRSTTSAIASVSLATIRKLNCSRESVLQELCHWLSEEEAKKYLEAFENETGAQVVRLASPEEAGLDGDFWAVKDGKEQLWYRTDGKWYTKDDMNGSCDKTNADSSLNCEVGSTKVLGTVTIYNDFADLDNDTTERLLRSRIEKAVPGAKVDFEKVNNTDVKVKIDCPDADAEKARQAVESSDVTKSVDWESATKELDSAKGTNKTTGSTTLNSSEEPEGDTDGGDVVGEGSEEVAMITTESGNEVALNDIKIVQNPDTNELALFVKETEDDEIPEGFVVIADAAQAALPANAVCPECGQEPCVCEGDESLDSSKKKNELNCESANSLKEAAAEVDEHEMLVGIVEAIEDLNYDDQVKEKMFGDVEGSLKELLASIDEHEALVDIIQASEDLLIVDEIMRVILGDDDPLDSEDFDDIDSSLNCAISEVTVPQDFARTQGRMSDLKHIIENELRDKNLDITIQQVARPDSTTIRIGFDGSDEQASEADDIIEHIVTTLVRNGWDSFNAREGDSAPIKQSADSSLEPSTADVNKPKKQFQVYYEDENGNEIEKPAVITVSDNLEGMDLYEAIQEQFEVEYPGCFWTTICDMNDEVKMDSSRKSELNSSVHDNPALKLFVEKIKEGAKQVSTVPTTEGEGSGYKIIIRGMEPTEIEPIAAEFGIQLSGIKPLEDGFAVVVDNDSLNSSEVDLDDSIVDDGAMRYKDYLITGGEKSGGYIAVSPYGKFSPHIYKTIDECKAAIDKDIKFRFPEQ